MRPNYGGPKAQFPAELREIGGRVVKVKYRQHWYMQKMYGLSARAYMDLIEAQEGRCAICKCELNFDGRTHIDHDHTTGKIRGILCGTCNQGLGCFRDNVELIQTAISYLEAHTCTEKERRIESEMDGIGV